MGIEVASSFTRKAAVPLDDLTIAADLTARDAIEEGVRYEGMVVYVVSEGANYQLVGGILNANWEDFGSGGGSGGGVVELKPNDTSPSPSLIQTNPIEYWRFSADDEFLWGRDVVPASYKSGDKINLELGKVFVNGSVESEEVFFVVAAFLFKDGTNPLSMNGYSHWNTANGVTGYSGWLRSAGFKTLESGENNKIFSVEIEISSGGFHTGGYAVGGEQDGVNVEAGDLIIFGLQRYTVPEQSFQGDINVVDKTFRLNYKGE